MCLLHISSTNKAFRFAENWNQAVCYTLSCAGGRGRTNTYVARKIEIWREKCTSTILRFLPATNVLSRVFTPD